MYKNVFKRLAVAALAAVLVCSLFACGPKNPRTTVDLEAVGYQWEDTQAPIVKEKGLVNYRILSQKNALAPQYNDMKIFKDLYDMTNVDINWENISESAYAERKPLILSDKDNYPDAIYHAGFSAAEIVRYSTRKVILPISDYLQYMPNFSRILASRPDIRKAITSYDGKIYSLPRIDEMGITANPNLLFMNKAWLSAYIDAKHPDFVTKADIKDGLQLNLRQMQDILEYFRDNDMNGNGRDDELPLSFVYNNWQGNQTDLFGAFGLAENTDHLTIVDGQVTCTALDEKFRTAANFINGWVKNGLIDRSVFENSQDAFLASGKGVEKLGAFYWWESATVVSNPDNYVLLRPLKGLNNEETVLGVSNYPEISYGTFVILSVCPNPEILLTYMDRFYDPVISAQINYGPIGVVYEEERDANGKLVQKPIPEGLTADEFRVQNAPLGVMCLTKPEWDTVVNMEPRAQLRLERLEQFANPYNPQNITRIPTLAFTLDEINKLSRVESNVQDYMYMNLTNWLLKDGVDEKDFAAFKSELSGTVGLSTLLQVYQSAYNRYLQA